MSRKLTKQIIASAKAQDRESIVWDGEVPGLGLRVTPRGAKSFILKTRIGGGRSAPIKKPTLGKVGDLTLDQARVKARAWKVLAADGIDPGRHKVEMGRTVADLCAEYLEVHAPRKRSSGDDQAKIKQHILPRLGRRLIRDVTFSDVERLHRSMREAPYAANRTMALLSKMFSLAIKWEWTDRNPASGIERYPEERRERFLGPEEIGRLSSALQNLVASAARPSEAQKVADALRLLMLTGARRSEVLSATWSMFDLETGVWTKPSSHTKQKKEHRVPLSPPAIQLLTGIKDQGDGSEYVFPSRARSKHPHMTELKSSWAKVCKLADLEGVRIHDLRHTYASILVSGGATLPLIGALLGHTQVQTTQRYAHLADDPLREATTRVGAVVTGSGMADIIKIER
ncbi:MAG: site-specific integrase [Proteobacteria bacterium]|nr:site-specific integrase [Pseudomonadota bacterium]